MTFAGVRHKNVPKHWTKLKARPPLSVSRWLSCAVCILVATVLPRFQGVERGITEASLVGTA